MSQYKNRNKWKELVGKYNVTCDRSGFVFDNHEVITDHRNRVVARKYADPIHWTEVPQRYPIDTSRLPFKRPVIETTENPTARFSWSQTRFTWSELHRLWSARY